MSTKPQPAQTIKLGIVGLVLVLGALGCHSALLRTQSVPLSVALRPVPKERVVQPPPYTFPNGGRTLFPAYRLVALYGTPNAPALGVLGEQPIAETIARAKQLAAAHQPYVTEHILPTLEIITTVASATPTDNGDYSREVPLVDLQPWITAARDAGVYVVLDLQPGRSNFLQQAQAYELLLEQPNVGLALDPEWRLGPGQVPLAQIGTVNIGEVNAVDDWLSALTDRAKLPQKLFLLHQFRLSMIPERALLRTTHPNLAYVVQMDGQGQQPTKQETWRTITAAPPPNVQFGWKNFYAKDSPMLDPASTMAITPKPWYISYQ
ncbi:MAG TPA: hypothetical protein VJR27_01480 [Candidatus Saccharimonadales bacterium]|nr:hypothetical protein [Candidatus Saccharimonadales bacterium]